MFDKLLFNRNAFDRSVSSSNISLPITSSSTLVTKLVVRVALSVKPFSGTSSMSPNLRVRQNMASEISGIGKMMDSEMILSMSLYPTKLSGSGRIIPELSIQTPFKGKFVGAGNTSVNNKLYFLQYVQAGISAGGDIHQELILQNNIGTLIKGDAHLAGTLSLHLPIPLEIAGKGEITLRRLSAMNENILELIGINLLPGETITIDTDLLQVLLGSKEDVSAVTSDSVFFELYPGENEILISTDTDTEFEVTAIWQNRWL